MRKPRHKHTHTVHLVPLFRPAGLADHSRIYLGTHTDLPLQGFAALFVFLGDVNRVHLGIGVFENAGFDFDR